MYANIELEPMEKALDHIKRYDLDSEGKRDDYYNALRELSTDRTRWVNFLAKVDKFRNTPR